MPSEAVLPAFLAAVARPLCLRRSTAFSKSPALSTSAFLHSIMPAPVFSRRSLTASADIVVIQSPPGPLRARSFQPPGPSQPPAAPLLTEPPSPQSQHWRSLRSEALSPL